MYRIFVSNIGEFRDSKNYEFIAEFAELDLTNQYIKWMRGKKRFQEKDIIVRECPENVIDPAEGEVEAVVTVLGECLSVDEIEFV